MKATTLFFLCILGSSILIAMETKSLKSIEWQKIELERHLKSRVTDSLKAFLDKSDFIVEPQIELVDSKTPDFNSLGDDEDKNANQDKNDNAPKNGKKSNKSRAKIRPSNVSSKNLPGDYIVFSKLGLEAPLIDDFDNFREETRIKEIIKNGSGALDNLYGKMKKGSDGISDFDRLWKFNKELNIFKKIKTALVNLKVNEEISDQMKSRIESFAKNYSFPVGDKNLAISLSFIPFKAQTTKLLDNFSKFSNLITAILSLAILGFIAFKLFKKYEDFQIANNQKNLSIKNENKDKKKDQKKDSLGHGANAESLQKVMERFVDYLYKSPDSASKLVRKWINDSSDIASSTLAFLTNKLENEHLLALFKYLSNDERKTWKDRIDGLDSNIEESEVVSFIDREIVEDMIIPNVLPDKELEELLLKMNAEEASKMILNNKDFGKVLLNTYRTDIISSIMSKLDEETLSFVLEDSFNFSTQYIIENVQALKDAASEVIDRKEISPFFNKMKQLISKVNVANESILYKELLKQSSVKEVIDLSKFSIPHSSITYMSEDFLNKVFKSYEFSKRVEYVTCVEEADSKRFVDIFAPIGSKARDMYEFELRRLSESLDFQRTLKNSPETILVEFLGHVRDQIREDKTLLIHVEEGLNSWIQTLGSNFERNDKEVTAS